MKTFIITEKQNENSTIYGELVQAKNISSAKRKATSMQCFFGTVLTIQSENGTLIATKKDGKWN